jgi:hypothetical protein
VHQPGSAAEALPLEPSPENVASFDLAMACLNALNKAKSEAGVSAQRVVERMSLRANAATLAALPPVLRDVAGAARYQSYTTQLDAALEDSCFSIVDGVYAEKV